MMKYYVIAFLMIFSVSVFAQKADLPGKVVKTLDKKFPGVQELKWNVEKGDYKIKFVYEGKKTVVEIDPDGTWEKTSTHMSFGELPESVQATVNENKKNAEIDEIKLVVDDEGETYYKIDLKEGTLITKLWIDPDGKLTRSETENKPAK